jgi:hypothetical protein
MGGDGPAQLQLPAEVPTSSPRREVETSAQSVHLFFAAIAQGMSASTALEVFATFCGGSFSHDDKSFSVFPENAALGPIADRIGHLSTARRVVVNGCEGQGDTTIVLVSGELHAPLEDRSCRNEGGLEALPDFIPLPRDEEGRTIIPESWVMALVEARDAWASELGTLDAVTRSITRGQLVMPRVSAPSQQKALHNHPSLKDDGEAKRALGPVIAKCLASGVLEYVVWNDRMPILLQLWGEVPKGTPPFYHLITDARFANNFYSTGGSRTPPLLSSVAPPIGVTFITRSTFRTHIIYNSGQDAAASCGRSNGRLSCPTDELIFFRQQISTFRH